MKGRPKKPALIKKLEGNRGKFAKSQVREDTPGIGHPRPPEGLTEPERALWVSIVRSLPVGLLTRADEAALERMAVAWAEYRQVQALVRKSSLMVQSPRGPVYNPLLLVREKAAREMHLAGEVLGLSPVSRARLIASEAPDDDPMALLLGPDGDPTGSWATVSPGSRTKQ
jgi:P27 family predicted phage terminase small subunit